MRAYILILVLLTICNAADWNYIKGGSDWPAKYDLCKGNQQSPIDLETNVQQVDAINDNFTYHYENPTSTLSGSPLSAVVDIQAGNALNLQ